MLIELRTQQLADNIRKDMDLLEDYEDELRYETDPRRLARYRREIERQRESLSRYQQEAGEIPQGDRTAARVVEPLPAGV